MVLWLGTSLKRRSGHAMDWRVELGYWSEGHMFKPWSTCQSILQWDTEPKNRFPEHHHLLLLRGWRVECRAIFTFWIKKKFFNQKVQPSCWLLKKICSSDKPLKSKSRHLQAWEFSQKSLDCRVNQKLVEKTASQHPQDTHALGFLNNFTKNKLAIKKQHWKQRKIGEL